MTDRICDEIIDEYNKTRSIFFKCKSKTYKIEHVYYLDLILRALESITIKTDKEARTVEFLKPRVEKLFKKYCDE